jgi:hypothetical protein
MVADQKSHDWNAIGMFWLSPLDLGMERGAGIVESAVIARHRRDRKTNPLPRINADGRGSEVYCLSRDSFGAGWPPAFAVTAAGLATGLIISEEE